MRDGDAETRDRETTGHDTSGPTTDDAMTRSEEELRVGTTERESGRVRLQKYVVEEEVTETVPVRREEVRVEREPITDANRGDAVDGPAISEEEHEVVLHAEEVVVEKQRGAQGAHPAREGRHDRRGDGLRDGPQGAGRRRRRPRPSLAPMMQIGYFLASEEYDPRELIEQAKKAEQAGFHALWISDHYHPWNDSRS